MQGKIMKGIAGFYYVHVVESGVYECKAKGIFRKDRQKPLVGDNVSMEVLDEKTKRGNIVEILPRTNQLIRPAVANVQQALVIFSMIQPKPNFGLLDRFLILMELQKIHTVICFNKRDMVSLEEEKRLYEIYRQCGSSIIFSSAHTKQGIHKIHEVLAEKTTTVAGPSGAGKSSIINLLQPMAGMETGEVSRKIDRGKHTTRHSQLIAISKDTYIMDTPGFSSIYLSDVEKKDLKNYFLEFQKYDSFCRFQGCSHTHEPDCAVKHALSEGKINPLRYKSYVGIYEELKERRRY